MTYGNLAFDALGDPTRRAVLEIVAARPAHVAAIAARLPVSRPAVSQHLKRLQDAGLVRVQRQGTQNIYSLDPAGIAAMRTWLDAQWTAALSAFADFAQSEEE